jgi:hypothetical protein
MSTFEERHAALGEPCVVDVNPLRIEALRGQLAEATRLIQWLKHELSIVADVIELTLGPISAEHVLTPVQRVQDATRAWLDR